MSLVNNAAPALNPWARILSALEGKINRQSFDTWLKPTRFSHINGRKLFVRVPGAQFEAVGERYSDLIHEAIDNLILEIDEVAFVTPVEETPPVRQDGGFAPVHMNSFIRTAIEGTPRSL